MSAECLDVTGDQHQDLLVSTYSGGAHCCTTLYVVALTPPARLLLYYDAGNSGGYQVVDLNKDGRPELLLGDDGLAYFADLCDACSPSSMPLLACFRDGRFQDCTRAFPMFLREQIASQTQGLREALRTAGRDSFSQQSIRGAALGLYAAYLLAGLDATGWQAVQTGLGAGDAARDVMPWLTKNRAAVRKWASTRGNRLRHRP
jgi:hypothetical protein